MAEAVRWREHRRLRDLRLPALSVGLCGIPLAYYLALGHLDLSWGLAREASKHSFPLTAIVIGIAPLALVAAARLPRAAAGLPRADPARSGRWPR